MDGKPLRFATRHFGCIKPPAAPGAFAGDCSASRAGLWGSKIGRVRRQPCVRPNPGFDQTKFSQKKNSLDSRNRPNYHRQCCSTIRGRESRTMEGSWAMAHGTRSATMDAENQPRGGSRCRFNRCRSALRATGPYCPWPHPSPRPARATDSKPIAPQTPCLEPVQRTTQSLLSYPPAYRLRPSGMRQPIRSFAPARQFSPST